MIRKDSYSDLPFAKVLNETELLAWMNPRQDSYHSFHIERLTESLYLVRNSRVLQWYICNIHELLALLSQTLQLRKVDPEYEARVAERETIRLLSQDEIDDLLSDL